VLPGAVRVGGDDPDHELVIVVEARRRAVDRTDEGTGPPPITPSRSRRPSMAKLVVNGLVI
jgi:hypothetical protein